MQRQTTNDSDKEIMKQGEEGDAGTGVYEKRMQVTEVRRVLVRGLVELVTFTVIPRPSTLIHPRWYVSRVWSYRQSCIHVFEYL